MSLVLGLIATAGLGAQAPMCTRDVPATLLERAKVTEAAAATAAATRKGGGGT